MLVGKKFFNVSLHANIPDLSKPGTICLVPQQDTSSGESVFVMDTASDMICEFRFESSIFSVPRTCPDWCILHWYLESGLGVSDRSRITITVDADGTRKASIVGSSSNGDSQGRVNLVSSRDQFFMAVAKSPIPSICACSSKIFVNSKQHFRILGEEDFDFPIMIRQPVDLVHPVAIQNEIYALVLLGQRLTFLGTNQGSDRLSQLASLDGVVGPIAVSCDPTTRTVYLGCCMRDSVELWSYEILIDGTVLPPNLLHSMKSVNDPLSVGVRAPVSSQDTPRIACIDSSGEMHANFSLNLNETAKYSSVCFSEEYTIFLSSCGTLVEIYPLIPGVRPFVYNVSLPDRGSRIRTTEWRNSLVVVPVGSRVVIVRVFDPYTGISWIPVDLGESLSSDISLIELVDNAILSLNIETGQIERHKVPNELWQLRASARSSLLASHCMLQECLSFSTPNSPEWYKLPGALRDRVEQLISPSTADVGRNSDFFARKFLIAHAFSSLTTEDIAWASMSDFQPFILSSLFPISLPGLTWEAVKTAGVALWLREPGLLRDISDRIQKTALQEYMKSKDPKILDEKLSFWLAANGKQQLLASMFKQHGSSCASPAHTKISVFFTTDFSIPENSSKGIKNAFELVRQKRNGLAVAVFILSGAYQEAMDICCRQMEDIQLGLVLLELLKLGKSGNDNEEKLSQLSSSLWRTKLVSLSVEMGDIWIPLLHAFRTRELTSAIDLRKKFHNAASQVERSGAVHGLSNSTCFGFKIKKYDICFPSVGDLIKVFSDSMKRLNHTVPAEAADCWTAISEQDRLVCLYQTGCSQFAITSPTIHAIHPILKWAIHERIMLSRSDTSTS